MDDAESVTIPYKFIPRDYQLPALEAFDGGIRRMIFCWHRRSGKDKVCWNIMIREACKEVGTYFYFLPSYTQAKKVIWDNIDNDGFKMLDHIPDEIVRRKNETGLMVELLNGSIIQLIAADTFAQTSVGTNPKGVVFSEYSISNALVWNFLRPILLANKGWAIFNFTPRGMNHATKLLTLARERPKVWFTQVLTVDDTTVFTKEQLQSELDDGMPLDLWEQEYYCKIIEGASSVFRKIEENIHHDEIKAEPGRLYQLGIDLAKYQDFTVLTAIDLHTLKVAKQERFNKMDWNTQKEQIVKFIRYWNNGVCWMDTTGLGDPIFDDLRTMNVKIEPFKFNEMSREQLLNNLRVLIEQNKIKLPDDPILTGELRAFQYELSGAKVKMKVPESLHDDTVMSLGLACWGISVPIPIQVRPKPVAIKLQTYK